MATRADESESKELAGAKSKCDDANMKSSHANVCNVTSTREKVVMLFGINQAWDRARRKLRSNQPTASSSVLTPPNDWPCCSTAS